MSQTFISRQGYSVLKTNLPENELKNLKNELSVAPFVPDDYSFGKQTKYVLYKESENKIYIPRCYGLERFGPPAVDRLDDGEPIQVEFAGNLREEQLEPCNAFLKACEDPKRRGGILNLTCASGKTVLAIYLMCRLGLKTIVIVHKDFLLQQWKERIEQFAPAAKVGMIKAKIVDVEGKDIVIASLQSLSMKSYPKDLFHMFGFIVVDECHHTSAEVFCQALQKVTCKYSLGLSATIHRKDGLGKVFQWYLGKVVYSNCKQKTNDVVDILWKEFYDPNPAYGKEEYMMRDKLNVSKMINNICEFYPRIEYVTSIIHDVLSKEPKRKVLVLSDRKLQLELFMKKLSQMGYTCGYYTGGMKTEELKESEGKQVLLGTYAMVAEGFDVKTLDTLVLASPKSDVIQSVGRILREVPEKRAHIPIVVDIIDKFSLFERQGTINLKQSLIQENSSL